MHSDPVATGTHRHSSEKMRGFELKLIQGLPIKEIQWHDCRSDKLVPVRPNRWRVHPWLVGDRPVLGMTKAMSVDQALSAARIDPTHHLVYRILNAGNLCVLAKGLGTVRK